MTRINEAMCDTKIPIDKAGGHTVNLPAPVDCGLYAHCVWFLTDEAEMLILQQGSMIFNGTLTSFFVELNHTGILKYIVMRVLAEQDQTPS